MFEKYIVTSLTNDIHENKIDGNFSYQLNNSRNTFKKIPHIHSAAVSMTTSTKYQDKNYAFTMDLMMHQVHCTNSFLNNKRSS